MARPKGSTKGMNKSVRHDDELHCPLCGGRMTHAQSVEGSDLHPWVFRCTDDGCRAVITIESEAARIGVFRGDHTEELACIERRPE